MKSYIVQKPIQLGYDSNVHNPNPQIYKNHREGSVLLLSSEAPNGNVWFIDSDGERGKIECGEVQNLIDRGVLKFYKDLP
jgi:hypothetical protein